MTLLPTVVVLVAIVAQVSGVYVNIRAIHANEGRRGGGERVVQIRSNQMILSPYSATDRTQQFEKVDQLNSNKFFLYKYGDPSNRIAMLTSQTSGMYGVGAQPEKNSGAELLKQQFVLNGKKNQILCNGGERINGRLYTLQYRKGSTLVVGCGSNQDEKAEEFEILSTRGVTVKGNQFFLVNKQYPELALGAEPSFTYLMRGYSAKTLWTFEGVVGSPGKYRLRNVAIPKLTLSGLHGIAVELHIPPGSEIFTLEKVIDSPGDQWDYYRLMSTWIQQHDNRPLKLRVLPISDGKKIAQPVEKSFPYEESELWRLVPRYAAKDEGYIQLHRERGNPKDVEITTAWEMGLKKTSSQSMSTTTGVSVTLDLAVAAGPFSASLSSTVNHEISQSTSSSSETSWSRKTSITRTYPANKDCTLYQRKLSFSSLIRTDGLSQTPRDFKMVCIDE